MMSLIKFELTKIIKRKATWISAVVVFVMLIGICCLNVQSQMWSGNELENLTGFDAIAENREEATALAGTVTNERITEEFKEYRAFFQEEGELKDEYITEEERTDPAFFVYDNDHYYYFSTFLQPWMVGYENNMYVIWRVDTSQEVDLYAAIEQSLDAKLDNGIYGTWNYSDAERAYWHDRYDETVKPLEYGYHRGWSTIIDCFEFIMLVFIAICVGITPLFASEYREKTDSVILASRYGKSKLVAAKVIAGLVFTLGMMLIGILILVGLPLLFYGAEGGDLAIQLRTLTIPYALTWAQTVALSAGIATLVALGLASFMMFLSAKWKSTLSIMMIGVALVMIPIFLPLMVNGVVAHVAVLLPGIAVNFNSVFQMMISYPFGSFVVDVQIMILVVYALIIAIFVPHAMRAFRRHQVG